MRNPKWWCWDNVTPGDESGRFVNLEKRTDIVAAHHDDVDTIYSRIGYLPPAYRRGVHGDLNGGSLLEIIPNLGCALINSLLEPSEINRSLFKQ